MFHVCLYFITVVVSGYEKTYHIEIYKLLNLPWGGGGGYM